MFNIYLWKTASVLQQFLVSYFTVIYSWQLSSSEKSLFGKKTHTYISISQGFYDLDFFFSFFFLWQMPFYLVGYAKRLLHFQQPTILLAQRHLKTMCLTNFENVNSILNIFQEKHDFLVLTDPVIICICLRTTGRHLSY